MKKKKICAMFLTMAMAATLLAGCGNDAGSGDGSSQGGEAQGSSSQGGEAQGSSSQGSDAQGGGTESASGGGSFR